MARTDEQLAYETLQGNQEAFEELVHKYQQLVFTIAYRMIGQREEAEDVAQEVFFTVYQKMYQFDTSRRFAPWIQRITVNTCISHIRRKKKVVLINFDDSQARESLTQNVNYDDPAVMYDRKELREEISHMLLRLPESYRTMIVFRYQLGLTNQEIADALGISRENVEVKMHRARKSFRKILLQEREERRERNELSASR